MSLLTHIADSIWPRLSGLMPGELKKAELAWLASPAGHLSLLTRRRATMIVNRVRLIAFLFGVLTPLWSVIDYIVFPFPLWSLLAGMRVLASAAFIWLVVGYRPSGSLFDAYRAMALLFAIPTIFYVASHQTLASYSLSGVSEAIGAGYAFLPFVLMAGLSIFPLTLVENVVFATPMLLAHGVAGVLAITSFDWPSFAGTFWLLALITGVSTLAGMSQLAFMIALVRQAIRDPLTGCFSRRSGEEMLEMQYVQAVRSDTPLSVAFIDIDRFKSINDQFGHEAGDSTLIQLINHFVPRLRRGDMLVRWGGEEFLLIFPTTGKEQAIFAIKRLTEEGLGTRPDGMPLTASIGIAERSEVDEEDWRALIDRADHRMYAAKQGGRNRIVSDD